MCKYSFILVVVAGFLFPSFNTFKIDTSVDVIGTWTIGKAKDMKLRNLTFEFSDESVVIKNESGNVVASGLVTSTQEEVAIAADPFEYAQQTVLQIEVQSAEQISFPRSIRVTSVSSTRMRICYPDGKGNCYATLKRI